MTPMGKLEKIYQGLKIFRKREPYDASISVSHDEFWACEQSPEKFEETIVRKLQELGWIWNESEGCWSIYI